MAEPIDMPFAWDVALGGPVEEPSVIWGPDPQGSRQFGEQFPLAYANNRKYPT